MSNRFRDSAFKKQLIAALTAALQIDGCRNHADLSTAWEAVEKNSPISGKRARRALSECLAEANRAGTDIPEDVESLIHGVIASVDDRGGVLPDADGKLSHIHLRVEPGRKSAYVRAAQSNGETLSEWITRHCDREAGY